MINKEEKMPLMKLTLSWLYYYLKSDLFSQRVLAQKKSAPE